MTYRGRVQGGTLVLDEPVTLPEGTPVDVAVHLASSTSGPATLLERFRDLVGSCPDLPPDMAENHDHYLHGQDKK